MEERLVDVDLMFITNDQSSEVSHPGDAAFHLPTPLVPSQFAAILGRRLATIGLMRTDQVDAPFLQTGAQWIGVGGLVVDQPSRILPWSAASSRD